MVALVGWVARRVRGECGQVLVLNVLALVVLLGMSAFAIDVGSWYQTKRHDQAVADAAALAGAQALPDDPGQATTLAIDYANNNGFNLPSSAVAISSDLTANDTINVSFTHPSPTFFASVLGINTVTIGAHASARSDLPGAARYVAPIVVPVTNSMLQCTPPPCGGTTQITLQNLHGTGSGDGAGSFALLDLTQNEQGTAAAGTVADWMLNGDQAEMPLGTYYAEPSTLFNSGAFQQALQARVGSEVLFPVYQPPIINGGSNGAFNIIGWVAFHIDSQTAGGSNGTLTGHFTRYLAQGIQAANPGSQSDYGIRTIQLTK
jgi:Flp pilus assembly protein TadG